MIDVIESEQWVAAARSLRLDPYCSLRPRFLGLPDANAVLSSVDNDCRNARRSRLLRMAEGGTAALYAPTHVYWEIYRRLPRLASFSPVPLVDLRRHFEEEYLPVMRFVRVSAGEVGDPQVLAITDPDDVPMGQLAKLIAPCVVFSEDKSLRRPRLAPPDWRLAAGFAADIAGGSSDRQATGMVAVAPGWAAVELIKFLGRRTGISSWLLGACIVGGAIVVLRKPERRQAVGKYGMPMLQVLAEMLEEARVREERGLAGLREVILPAPPGPALRQRVAVVLARQEEPLLAREVQELIEVRFPGQPVPPLTEIRTVLSEGSEFVQPARYRWQFGRQAGPWRSRE